MRMVLLVAGLLALGGCANLQSTWNKVTGATVSPQAVYLAANTADSTEVIATTYLKTCHKMPTAFAACTKAIEGKVATAVRSVRQARNDVRAFLKSHPDALGVQGLYDALNQAQQTLTQIINNYNLASVKA